MEIGVVLFIIGILTIAVWIIFALGRMKHRFLTFFLIALILFSFISFNMVFKGKDISVKNISDLGNLVKIYFSWLGGIFSNIKTITTQAIKMNWESNKTA